MTKWIDIYPPWSMNLTIELFHRYYREVLMGVLS